MRIIYFDIPTIILQFILMISLMGRKMVNGRSNRLFMALLGATCFATIFDFCSEIFHIWNLPDTSEQLLHQIVCSGYFLFRNLVPCIYILYLYAVMDTWHTLWRHKGKFFVVMLPCIVIAGIVFANFWNHALFYFNDAGIYCRGPFIIFMYLSGVFYLVYGVIFLLRHKNLVSRGKFYTLMAMFPINMLAVAIQFFIPQALVEMFMTTMSIVLVMFLVQRPEETMHPILESMNYIMFSSDIQKAFYVKKPLRVLFIKLMNFSELLTMLAYEDCINLMKDIVAGIPCIYKTKNFPMELYYLENGLIALVTEKNDPELLRGIADEIVEKFSKPIAFNHVDLGLDPRIHIVRCPEDIDNYKTLMAFGDHFHFYLSSENPVNDFSDEKQQKFYQMQTRIDSIISNAIEKKKFQMYYQPIYSVAKKRFVSAEALIRLIDEEYGFVSPALFIPVAEKNGMIFEITEFVLDDVCRFLSQCRKTGMDLEYIEINLSMAQCMQKNLYEKIQYYIQKYQLEPKSINLEITETAANTAQDVVEENIRVLERYGIHFSVDDYGTGYSNLSRMMTLPFKIIKLDKSLADRVYDSRVNTMLKYTIHMLKEIGMEVVVEGIETADVAEEFQRLGCDFIQGYYYSKPLNEAQFVEFMKKHR